VKRCGASVTAAVHQLPYHGVAYFSLLCCGFFVCFSGLTQGCAIPVSTHHYSTLSPSPFPPFNPPPPSILTVFVLRNCACVTQCHLNPSRSTHTQLRKPATDNLLFVVVQSGGKRREPAAKRRNVFSLSLSLCSFDVQKKSTGVACLFVCFSCLLIPPASLLLDTVETAALFFYLLLLSPLLFSLNCRLFSVC
jgi:hypothetical protein